MASTAGSVLFSLLQTLFQNILIPTQTNPIPYYNTFEQTSTKNTMNTTNQPPLFSGYDLINYPVTSFIKDYNRWVAINNIPMDRKQTIFENCLEYPAATDYAAATAATGDLHANFQAVAGDAAAQLGAQTHNWRHIETWLKETYNGPDQQRLAKSTLSELYQYDGESPRQFLNRINNALRNAGYENAVIQQLTEQSWLSGINQEVKEHANGFTHLDFNDLVRSCEGYWLSNNIPTRQAKQFNKRNPVQQRKLELAPPKFQYQPRYAQQQFQQPYQQEEYQEPRQILQRTERRPRPNQRQQQQQPEDPDVAQLMKEFQNLKVNFTELQQQLQGQRQPAQRFYQRENYNRRDQLDPQDRYRRDQQYGNNQRRDYQNNQRDFNCFKCGEKGHMAKDCQTETNRRAQTPAPSRINTVEEFEEFDEDVYYASDEDLDDEEFDQVFPVVTEKKKRSSPYTKIPKEKKTRKTPAPILEEMNEDSEVPMPSDVGQSESVKEENLKTTRRTKTYETDSWKLIKDLPAGLTIEQLAGLSAVAREQLRRGLTNTKPTYTPVNAISTRSTPAYTTAQIERKIASVIIDTGAGISLISKAMVDRLGWSIDQASTRTLVVADGSKSIALGEMKDVPITFNNITVPTDMTVIEGDTYDIILGTDWLNKTQAKLDISAAKMRITYHGVIEIVNLDMTRGIRDQMSNTDSESDEESFVNNIHDQNKKWPKANKPARNSDDDEPSDAQREEEFQRTGGMEHLVTSLDGMSDPPFRIQVDYVRMEQEKRQGVNPWNVMRPLYTQRWWDQNKTDLPDHETNKHQLDFLHAIFNEMAEDPSCWKQKEETPAWGNDNKNWEDEDPNSEWKQPIHRPISISYDSTPTSAAMTLHEENFKKGRCKHGIRFHSPRDQCAYCNIEAAKLEEEARAEKIKKSYFDKDEDKLPSQIIHLFTNQEWKEAQAAQEIPVIKVKRLNNTVELPELKHEKDIGFDLQSQEDYTIKPMDSHLFGTGLALTPPDGYFPKIETRSSFAKCGFIVLGGVIDPGYTGEVQVILKNISKFQNAIIKKGDRIAQIVFIKAFSGAIVEVDELQQTQRGHKGFGSTGVNAVKREMDLNFNKTDEQDRHSYKLGERLNRQQQEILRTLLKDNEDLFALTFHDIQVADVKTRHEIDTGDHRPIKMAPYRLPPNYKGWVKTEIEKMLKSGIIEHSYSPWSSPIILVNKKDGPDGKIVPRMCVDYRKLNLITKKDAYPIPRTTTILENMKYARFLTVLDLFMGYNQIQNSEDAKLKTAFVTEDGHYQYTRMPFGPTNAPATFQRAMNEMFGNLIGNGVFVYIDDVTIYSNSFEEHLHLLGEVFKRLRHFQFKMKPKKCTFATHEVEVLGHVINEQGIKPAPSKINAVTNYPVPQNKADLRSFLGLISYYRNYIQGCSRITEPLSRMLKKDVKFQWSPKAQATFDKIKGILTSDKILKRPDFDKPFVLKTDASAEGLGALLVQTDDKGRELPVAYASRRTSATESKYGATQLEVLAVVWAVKLFHHYLAGRPFKLVTDHQAIKSLMNMQNPPALYARWIMRLLPYEIDVVYKPGKMHGDADALSRGPVDKHVHFTERLTQQGPFLRKTDKRRPHDE